MIRCDRPLAGVAKRVAGVDKSPEMIARARAGPRTPDLVFIEGDFFTADLPAAHYDFICSVTTIHHLDHEAALLRMRELLRPGGTLVVVGLARDATPADCGAGDGRSGRRHRAGRRRGHGADADASPGRFWPTSRCAATSAAPPSLVAGSRPGLRALDGVRRPAVYLVAYLNKWYVTTGATRVLTRPRRAVSPTSPGTPPVPRLKGSRTPGRTRPCMASARPGTPSGPRR
jgi:SAM-dependent methyltransferase